MKVLKVIEYIMTGLLVVVIVSVLGVIYVPKILGYTPYTVISGSMSQLNQESDRQYYKENYGIDDINTYSVGCITYVKKIGFNDIQKGDVITYKIGNTVVTHMVIDINKETKSLTTHGINNSLGSNENDISYSNVIGKATSFSIPFAGYILSEASSSSIRILLITYIILFIIIIFANNMLEKLNNDEKAKDEEKTNE